MTSHLLGTSTTPHARRRQGLVKCAASFDPLFAVGDKMPLRTTILLFTCLLFISLFYLFCYWSLNPINPNHGNMAYLYHLWITLQRLDSKLLDEQLKRRSFSVSPILHKSSIWLLLLLVKRTTFGGWGWEREQSCHKRIDPFIIVS